MADVLAPGEFITFVKQGGNLNPCPSLRSRSIPFRGGAKRRGNPGVLCPS